MIKSLFSALTLLTGQPKGNLTCEKYGSKMFTLEERQTITENSTNNNSGYMYLYGLGSCTCYCQFHMSKYRNDFNKFQKNLQTV